MNFQTITTRVSPCMASLMNPLNYASKIVYHSAMDSIAYSGAFLAAAVAAHFFFPFIAAPLAITAVSIYFANITVNLLQEMPYAKIKSLNQKLLESVDALGKRCPYIQYSLWISAFAISLFSLAAGSALIVAYSLLMAVKINIQKNMDHNNVVVARDRLVNPYPHLI
jgi:hypothetical protein